MRKFSVNRPPKKSLSGTQALLSDILSPSVAIYYCVILEKLLNLSLPHVLIHNMRIVKLTS